MDGVDFKEFLSDLGLLEKFRKRCGPGVLDEVLENEDPCDFCISCFRFDDTPEGFGFWDIVNRTWLKCIEDHE